MTTLAHLNNLRTSANMKPLKAWKESKVKLLAAIAKLEKIAADDEGPGVPSPTNKSADAMPVKVKAANKPAGKHTEGLISVATIAKDLNMDPKVARAKLRRAFADAEGTGRAAAGSSDSRWMFTKDQAAKAKAILEGDKRKK